MSRLLMLQNQLKIRARADKLADHQLRVFHDIAARRQYPQKLNLFGPAGAGKTFLGWALAYELDAAFCAAPELLEPPPAAGTFVIVDNVDVEAYPFRRLLAALELYNVRSALLISRAPNPGLLPALRLPAPEADDLTVVLHNLSELEFYALNSPESTNLWAIIRATLQGGPIAHEH